MKKNSLFSLLILSFLVLSCGGADSQTDSATNHNDKMVYQDSALDANSPNHIFNHFVGTSPSGQVISLNEIAANHKYILLDFWASWCGPCRQNNPALVSFYEQYKDKGLGILSISLDKNKEKWLEAIKSDNLNWPNHISDLKGWDSKYAAYFQVKQIPTVILLDSTGKVVYFDASFEEISKLLN
ncbi:MAG: TlpA family protein disulfide reductase [Chitinophagales bacterium]|nr:TlpA family protein disulfide reductase [Chitinophagales bacterium]